MSNTDMWSLIIGFFLPIVIAFVQQQTWTQTLRAIVGFLACLVAAVGTVLIQLDTWNWHAWVQSALLIIVTAISTYEGFWKKTQLVPRLEVATSRAIGR
jgi:hypothetical protein